MKKILLATISMLVTVAQAIAADNLPPLQAVPKVDLDRYTGVWHEIASFPQRFQKGWCCQYGNLFAAQPTARSLF